MSASLENRSSLRKLEFPNSTQEALTRLYSTFSAFSGASTSLSMPPKETEIILVKYQPQRYQQVHRAVIRLKFPDRKLFCCRVCKNYENIMQICVTYKLALRAAAQACA